jgi:hypothetical protein
MAKRWIDTDALLFDAKLFNSLGPRGVLLYIHLWGIAEAWGGYEAEYENISLKSGALNISPQEVKEIIEKLIDLGKIIRYEVAGREYHWIKNLIKHQPTINRPVPTIPLPPWVTYEEKRFQSGKRYANYSINDLVITGSVPVVSADITKPKPIPKPEPKPIPKEKEKPETPPDKPKTPPKKEPYSADFLLFWKTIRHRPSDSKFQCWTKWQELRRNKDLPPVEILLQSARLANAVWAKDNYKFVIGTHRFLNQRLWESEGYNPDTAKAEPSGKKMVAGWPWGCPPALPTLTVSPGGFNLQT